MNEYILNILDSFEPIDLNYLENNFSLLERLDYKFLINIQDLPSLLNILVKNEYKILEIKNHRIFTYRNIYYDTKDFEMYLLHHNGKINRYKIRKREYVESSQIYLEIKQKSFDNKIIKYRKKLNDNNIENDNIINKFIENYSPYKRNILIESLHNQFQRITLINEKHVQRLTIDFNLIFKNTEFVYLPEIAIVEIKLPKNTSCRISNILKKFNLKQCNFSKYCIGIALTKKHIKKNNFKQTILMINKIKNFNY